MAWLGGNHDREAALGEPPADAQAAVGDASVEGESARRGRVATRATAVTLALRAGWDASLTYDARQTASADESPTSPAAALFVGRQELVGSLVNAISQPDRRGTYLVSGYRGAGKTSLVIESARQAISSLEQRGHELLPLVLNVSEVSASLGAAGDASVPPLGIDARRLLIALLRALRNKLDRGQSAGLREDEGGRLRSPPEGQRLAAARAMIDRACDKAEASAWSRRAQEVAELELTGTRRSDRSFGVGDLFRFTSVVTGFGALAVGGAAIVGSASAIAAGACAALGGVAVASFRQSRVITQRVSTRATEQTELLFDNSLQQIEADLKQILGELHKAGMRTMFVLEELDKVDDHDGAQLDAVIRYFKNLFTQAPALFFFLTDKQYFDLVEARMATGRRVRSYAVEQTFFTHRVFVARPPVDDCLDYLQRILPDEAAQSAVAAIRDAADDRSRALDAMDPVERFLRVVLFTSQNHLFDLKNELRRYVRMTSRDSRLEFDDRSFPPRDHGLAVCHFLLEQKIKLYTFSGGRDYANEVVRECLSAALADTDERRLVTELYPSGGELANLRRDDRRFIVEAIDSLLGDLARGRAIELVRSPSDEGSPLIGWRENAVSSFSLSPRLEAHEEALREALQRAVRICEQLAGKGPLPAGPPLIGSVPAMRPRSTRSQRRDSR